MDSGSKIYEAELRDFGFRQEQFVELKFLKCLRKIQETWVDDQQSNSLRNNTDENVNQRYFVGLSSSWRFRSFYTQVDLKALTSSSPEEAIDLNLDAQQ